MNQIMAASMVGQQGKFFVLKQPPLPQKAFSNRITQKNNKKTKIYFKSTEMVSLYFFML